MKWFKGVYALLMIIGIALVGYASDQSPQPKKQGSYFCLVQTEVCSIEQCIIQEVAFTGHSMCDLVAILPDAYREFQPPGYLLPLKIGEPTGQLHESKLLGNHPTATHRLSLSSNLRC